MEPACPNALSCAPVCAHAWVASIPASSYAAACSVRVSARVCVLVRQGERLHLGREWATRRVAGAPLRRCRNYWLRSHAPAAHNEPSPCAGSDVQPLNSSG
eukprot:6212790-Pleurochrysis_carterae.AAC.4